MTRKIIIVAFLLLILAILISERHPSVSIQLLDPEMSPHPAVLQGFRIMQETKKYAPEYAIAWLNCNSCHFDGGNSLGGQNNGIPLVGVSQKYPTYSYRDKKTISLEERIDNCFRRSLNGKAVPPTSPIMQDLVAYFNWISKPAEVLKERPWLGYKPLKLEYKGVPEQGQMAYGKYCADCHGKRGEGTVEREGDSIPPLWGNHSFNDGAGMNKPEVFAWFIYWNMPFQDPTLTEKEALDIAAFVTQQPRPKFEK